MKIGLIGAGNMGGAIIRGFLKNRTEESGQIYICDHGEKSAKLIQELSLIKCKDQAETARQCNILLLAVKPVAFEKVLSQTSQGLTEDTVIVSVAAGISLLQMEMLLRETCDVKFKPKLVRAMPNTPALVGEGMTGLSRNAQVSDEEFSKVMEIFKAVGQPEEVSEKLMDAVVGVSGSSPAYVYMFIEALADGAVIWGMPREKAYKFAAQAVLGSAKMVLETGLHPGELKDMVCSPGGATIDAVEALERAGFRSAVIKAVSAASEKSRKMGD